MNRRANGFATVVAVSLVALTAMALTAMMWRLRNDAQDARMQRIESQLQQLLFAGAAQSIHLAAADSPQQVMNLPPALREKGAQVTLTAEPGDAQTEKRITVEAAFENVVQRQTLHYTQGAQGWTLTDARLE